MAIQPQDPEAVFKHALRLVARQVRLVEEARHLELVPARRAEAVAMFEVASLLYRERMEILAEAGLIERAEPWIR